MLRPASFAPGLGAVGEGSPADEESSSTMVTGELVAAAPVELDETDLIKSFFIRRIFLPIALELGR